MLPFERLKAWHACMELWVAVYRATEQWPKREWYGLASQIRGAANSAGSNLAEGVVKFGPRELRKHTNIAIGSLAEVAHQLRAAQRVGLLSQETFDELIVLQQHAAKLTWGLLRGLQRHIRAATSGRT